MKITIITGQNSDYCEWQKMKIDGKSACSVYPLYDCPEDAIIGRDLISCTQIAEYMRMAYEAGKNGEVFEIEEAQDNE